MDQWASAIPTNMVLESEKVPGRIVPRVNQWSCYGENDKTHAVLSWVLLPIAIPPRSDADSRRFVDELKQTDTAMTREKSCCRHDDKVSYQGHHVLETWVPSDINIVAYLSCLRLMGTWAVLYHLRSSELVHRKIEEGAGAIAVVDVENPIHLVNQSGRIFIPGL